jgi:hypothetical protein
LLFPSKTGGFRYGSVLDKPFQGVCNERGFSKRFTPRGMRRTFQDIARAANISDVVTRSISGHLTERMHHHYSTVAGIEQQASLSKIASGRVPRPCGRVDARRDVKWTRMWTRRGGQNSRTVLKRSELACFSVCSRAGEGIRTLDVHLGKTDVSGFRPLLGVTIINNLPD